MIHLMSQREAEQSALPASRVQSISPYVNPAHVLAPPRRWLEALASGEYSWQFFRLRYKNLLRRRYAVEPERFHALLDGSAGAQEVVLTCHCTGEHCHREPAADFLERLREQRRAATSRPRTAPRRAPPAREWARSPQLGMVLTTLIEAPPAAHP